MLKHLLVSLATCLQGGEQLDLSQYIVPTVHQVQVRVVLKPAGGTLIIYSPGHEDHEARFSEAESLATIPINGSILCVRATGGPFDFDVQLVAVGRRITSKDTVQSSRPASGN